MAASMQMGASSETPRARGGVTQGAAVGVEVSDLQVRYDDHRVLENINLSIAAGSIVTLLGASGCGKTTLLRVLGGLLQPDRGELVWKNALGAGRGAPTLGYCFQDGRLLPWRNLEQNLTLALEGRSELDGATRKKRAQEMLARVGLSGAAPLYPHQVSGGMRMRAAVARALINAPQLLLLDEPFASVDALTRLELDQLIVELWRQRPMTVVWVTHSIEEALLVSQEVFVLKASAQERVQRWTIPEGPRGIDKTSSSSLLGLSEELLHTLRA